MVLCFLTGQKARKVLEKGSLSRVGDQAVGALAMAVLDLRVLGDLDCIVNFHSSTSSDAFDLAMTQQSQDRPQVLRVGLDQAWPGLGASSACRSRED